MERHDSRKPLQVKNPQQGHFVRERSTANLDKWVLINVSPYKNDHGNAGMGVTLAMSVEFF
jgi:hypothetical protein